jgi:hypothetical protein
MTLPLEELVQDFADGVKLADSRRPVAVNSRTKVAFQAGVGPHSETETVRLVMKELAQIRPELYKQYRVGVAYPDGGRQKCDLCFGLSPDWEWAIELKMLRLLGDNGKLNDNMLMHILSPYPQHRSALTDCEKLANSGLNGRKAVMIYAFEAAGFPAEPTIRAFESLARDRVSLSLRLSASFKNLVHPVHTQGSVVGWEILASKRA